MMDIEIEGMEELEANLEEIIQLMAEATLAMVRRGEEVLEEEADNLAPKKGVMAAKVRSKTKNQVVIDFGPNRDNWTLRFFETGATQHEIRGNPLIFEGASGDVIKTYAVDHPGMPAKPFMRPALDGKGDQAMEEAGEVFWNIVKRD